MKDRGTDTADGRWVGSGWLVGIEKNIPQLELEGHGDPPEVIK